MNCTLQYPKKTPYEVRKEMDRIEKSESKPLTSCQINGIDWEKRIQNRQKRRDRETKEADMVKKSLQKCSELMLLAKSASYIMIKRGEEAPQNTRTVLKQIQDQVAKNYIDSLKKERDRSLREDLWGGALSGGLTGAQYGLLSGLLFGTTVAPAKDLASGSDRSMWHSIGRGAGLGGASGMGAGALLGAGVGAINNWATRDLRKQRAIQKLKELGITD